MNPIFTSLDFFYKNVVVIRIFSRKNHKHKAYQIPKKKKSDAGVNGVNGIGVFKIST